MSERARGGWGNEAVQFGLIAVFLVGVFYWVAVGHEEVLAGENEFSTWTRICQ